MTRSVIGSDGAILRDWPAGTHQGFVVLPSCPPSRPPLKSNPHSAAAPPLPNFRDFVPWRFSVAGHISAWIASSSRRPKTLYGATFVKLVLPSSISLFDRVASHLLVPT